MTVEWMNEDVGAWADWAGALAGLASAGFGVAALRTARQANQLAAQVAREEGDRERRRDEVASAREREQARKDDERERRVLERERMEADRAAAREQREDDLHRRSLAASLQAWWVKTPGDEWGILVVNAGRGASVLHDVEIQVSGSNIQRPIKAPHLPPGTYFVESKGQSWPFPEPVRSDEGFIPITSGSTHSVDRITFRDTLGQSWNWTPGGGLRPESSVA